MVENLWRQRDDINLEDKSYSSNIFKRLQDFKTLNTAIEKGYPSCRSQSWKLESSLLEDKQAAEVDAATRGNLPKEYTVKGSLE